MAPVRRLVLDVLKPHEPELVEFADRISAVDDVEAVNVAVIEIDREVQNVKVAIEGEALDFDTIRTAIEDLGATIHSTDEAACGDYLVYDTPTASQARPAWLR